MSKCVERKEGPSDGDEHVRKWESASKAAQGEKITKKLFHNINAIKATKSMEVVMMKRAMGAKKRILDRRRAAASAHRNKLERALEDPATIQVSVRIVELASKSKVPKTYAALCVISRRVCLGTRIICVFYIMGSHKKSKGSR